MIRIRAFLSIHVVILCFALQLLAQIGLSRLHCEVFGARVEKSIAARHPAVLKLTKEGKSELKG